jgi:carboxymethylenebutenolidase
MEVCMRSPLLLVTMSALAAGAFAQEAAKERLEKSPRHHEWLQIKQGSRTVHAYLVYPESASRTPAIVVIHENRGLTDWVRSVADQLAEAGYIAIAPDLLSGAGPDGGKTSDFPDSDAAREAISKLPPEQVLADLNAVADHVAGLPASNGKVAVAGFCWGGARSFQFATARPGLAAAYVFYGTGPDDPEAIAKVGCPVYGFYGGDDARVNATVPRSTELMQQAGKTYEPVTYEGAGHGFMRSGEAPDASEANRKAREEAWTRWKELLKKLA